MGMEAVLQEIDSNKESLDAIRPLDEKNLKRFKEYYRIGLTYTSNALEGNSLTISETKVILEDGLTVGGKPLRDVLEVAGHSQAYDYMFSLIRSKELTTDQIKMLHRLFYQAIDDANAGEYRKENVIITGSQYPTADHRDIEDEMEDLVQWANEYREMFHPVQYAALLHQKFIFIHPFVDGNGRTARLLMNLALIQAGYEIAVIPPVVRQDYVQYLEKAHWAPESFQQFIAERVVETQRDMLRLLQPVRREERLDEETPELDI